MARGLYLLVLLGIVYTEVMGQRSNNDTVSNGFLFKNIAGNEFQIRSITDGILVTGGKRTLGHIAVWTVLVTLDVPTEQVGLLDKLNAFQQVLYAHNRISNLTKSIWAKSTMKATLINQRTRRGLVNVVGLLSNRLFGTATEAQISETHSQIENIAKQNKRVVKVVKELITIVNHSHDYSKIINEHIQSLEKYVLTVAFEIRKSDNITDKLSNRVSILEQHFELTAL